MAHVQQNMPVHCFRTDVALDSGQVTLSTAPPNGGPVGPVAPTYTAPFGESDLAAALDAGTVYGEHGETTIRLKRPPLPNTGETTDQWLASVPLQP